MRRAIRRIVDQIKLRRAPSVVRSVRNESLTYLSVDALCDLHNEVARIEREHVDGILIEAGCALGGSAIVIASAKSRERPFHVYDVFGMIPAPSERDGGDVHQRYDRILSGQSQGIGGNMYYGYEENLLQKVADNFRRHGVAVKDHQVQLIRGLFRDTLHIHDRVALAHLDGDWYESVMTCLQRIEPHLVPGGVLVVDDYYYWSGCRTAVDEYFRDRMGEYTFVERARLHIVRGRSRADGDHVSQSTDGLRVSR